MRSLTKFDEVWLVGALEGCFRRAQQTKKKVATKTHQYRQGYILNGAMGQKKTIDCLGLGYTWTWIFYTRYLTISCHFGVVFVWQKFYTEDRFRSRYRSRVTKMSTFFVNHLDLFFAKQTKKLVTLRESLPYKWSIVGL